MVVFGNSAHARESLARTDWVGDSSPKRDAIAAAVVVCRWPEDLPEDDPHLAGPLRGRLSRVLEPERMNQAPRDQKGQDSPDQI